MTDPAPEPKKPSRPSIPCIEAQAMEQLAREAIEAIGADAVIVVWTRQRRRRTEIKSTAIGNMLTVQGLMRWVRERIDELEDKEKDEEEEEDEDDDD